MYFIEICSTNTQCIKIYNYKSLHRKTSTRRTPWPKYFILRYLVKCTTNIWIKQSMKLKREKFNCLWCQICCNNRLSNWIVAQWLKWNKIFENKFLDYENEINIFIEDNELSTNFIGLPCYASSATKPF